MPEVRPEGACQLWRRILPRELSIDLVADEEPVRNGHTAETVVSALENAEDYEANEVAIIAVSWSCPRQSDRTSFSKGVPAQRRIN